MQEGLRRCLGCRKLFDSDSPANRFCKACKKRRRSVEGSLEPLDPDHLPLAIAREVKDRYYPSFAVEAERMLDRPVFRKVSSFKPRPLPAVSLEWGPAPPTSL